MPIPKRIISSRESAYTFSSVHEKCWDTFSRLNPTYELLFFSSNERRTFIQQRRPCLLGLYDGYLQCENQIDLFRIVALEELGGFFLNLDLLLHKCLDPLLRYDLILTEETALTNAPLPQRHGDQVAESDLGELGHYALAASPGHWFLGELLEAFLIEDVFEPEYNNALLNDTYRRVRDRFDDSSIVLRARTEGRWGAFGEFGNYLNAPKGS